MKKVLVFIIVLLIFFGFSHSVFSSPKEKDEKLYFWMRLTIANNASEIYVFKEPIEINIPFNDTYQTSYFVNMSVYLNNVKIKDIKYRMERDECNNTVMLLYLDKILPRSFISIELLFYLRIKRFNPPVLNYNVSGKIRDIPSFLKERFTKSEGVWLYNSEGMKYLVIKAKEIVGSDDNVLRIVSRLVDYIWTKIRYETYYRPRYPNETLPFEKMEGGLGKGDCDDQSNLLILILRSLGIPSYLVIGYVGDFDYGADRSEYNISAHYYYNFKGINLLHGWVSVYIPPWGWLPIDLTFSASKNNFLYSINTSIVSEYWEQYRIIPIKYTNICHRDYIKKDKEELRKIINTSLYYYDEYAIISYHDNIIRIKRMFEPLPLPWIKKTSLKFAVPSSVNILSNVTIKGNITPPLSNILIHLKIVKPSGKIIEKNIVLRNGLWNATFMVDESGLWTVNASFPGTNTYTPSSMSKQFLVRKIKTRILLDVKNIDGNIIVNGSLFPFIENATININFLGPNGTKKNVETMVNDKGVFYYTYNVSIPGNWKIITTWLGNNYYEYSLNFSNIYVKLPSSLKIKMIKDVLYENEDFSFEGCLIPSIGSQKVILYLISENSVRKNITMFTDDNGCFNVSLKLKAGKWNLTSVFPGNSMYDGSSYSVSIEVYRRTNYMNTIVAIIVVLSLLAVTIVFYLKRKRLIHL
ncbi:MAG: transglutaminase domain-containing protein [Thermoproteales archaeon]|nr:transglutaminase domain-containing protein [Thermoproteales archaeon]